MKCLALLWLGSSHGWQLMLPCQRQPPGRRPTADRRRVTVHAEQKLAVNPYVTLTAITVVWGSQHSVIKWAVGDGDASSVTAARFVIAALCLWPWAPRDLNTWRSGLELGLLSFAGFATQAVGLETTTATKSAFLLYLNVKLVPVVALLSGKGLAPPAVWFWAVVAFAGTFALSTDSGGTTNWVIGDVWSLLAALASAIFIVRLDDLSEQACSSAGLASATATTTAVMALIWTQSADAVHNVLTPDQSLAALYLGIAPSAVCGYLQTKVQRYVTATRAAVVYALDPIWAAAWANLLLDEKLGQQGVAGACLVATAAIAQPLQDTFYKGEATMLKESSSDL